MSCSLSYQRSALPTLFSPVFVLICLASLFFYAGYHLLTPVIPLYLHHTGIHGLGIGVLLLGGYSHLRDYLNGRIAQYDKNIKVGEQLSTNHLNGFISEIGRLGLRLKNNKGLQRVEKHHIA